MVVPVTLYSDATGGQVVVIDTDFEPASPVTSPPSSPGKASVTVGGHRVTVADLLEAGLLNEGEELEFIRPTKGEHHRATIQADGSLQLEDGHAFTTPSAAAGAAANGAFDGWHACSQHVSACTYTPCASSTSTCNLSRRRTNRSLDCRSPMQPETVLTSTLSAKRSRGAVLSTETGE
jgi:hypothetical protein